MQLFNAKTISPLNILYLGTNFECLYALYLGTYFECLYALYYRMEGCIYITQEYTLKFILEFSKENKNVIYYSFRLKL
jgi:hypothetical protein